MSKGDMPSCRKGSRCTHLYNLAGLSRSCWATHFVKCHTKCIPWDGMYRGVPAESTSSHHSCGLQRFFVFLVSKKRQKYQVFYSSNSPRTKTIAWYFPKFLKSLKFPISKTSKTKAPSPGNSTNLKHISEHISDLTCIPLYSVSINSTLKPKPC